MKEMQGKGLGLKMINGLDSVAQNIGCYKTILNCGEHNEAFYVKCGYKRSCIEMVHYYEDIEGKNPYHCG
jgi:glucosamine-phosphate N-acetyltransferase